MKVTISRRIGFFEVDPGLRLRLKPLVNCMQEAAAAHSDRARYGNPELLPQGRAWVLHRMVLEIHRPPALGDELHVATWYRGGGGVRSYRDFEIHAGAEKLVSAASLWLLIHRESKKILRIPGEVNERYGTVDARALEMDMDAWKPDSNFEPEIAVPIPTRPSDYDPLGHVNNAVYFDYVETLMERLPEHTIQPGVLAIQFSSEIPREVSEIRAGLKNEGETVIFKLMSGMGLHAAGEWKPA